jgi:NADP-dependent 3-hydroxy acid dehydrogenase YdfG
MLAFWMNTSDCSHLTLQEADMPADPTLQGRVALVTGASSGIGRAIAERLAADGGTVHLLGRTPEPMARSVAAIESEGGTAHAHTLDVRDLDALAQLIDTVADDNGRLDVMVNNAGTGDNRPILGGDLDDWRRMFDVNVMALLVGSTTAVEAMRRTGSGGHIINISSIAAQRPDGGVYGATKATVNYLTSGLRQELEADDIRITSVMPGVVATNFVRNFEPEVVQAIGALVGVDIDFTPGAQLPDEVLEKAQAALETHIARPEDIADAIAYVVALPRRLNLPEIVVRPAQSLDF